MRKLFGKLNMSWLTVAIFAAITGIYSGLVMLVPALKETSFQDIGISYEWWLIFAVIVVVNCNKWWDAALKCFVFFLLSQPICYLVQIPFSAEMTFNMAFHYYYPFWLVMTLLTIPGGLVAYFCKTKCTRRCNFRLGKHNSGYYGGFLHKAGIRNRFSASPYHLHRLHRIDFRHDILNSDGKEKPHNCNRNTYCSHGGDICVVHTYRKNDVCLKSKLKSKNGLFFYSLRQNLLRVLPFLLFDESRHKI